MKILNEKEYPVILKAGDTITLLYGDERVLSHVATEEKEITGAVLFEFEPGDVPNIKYGLGGAFIYK